MGFREVAATKGTKFAITSNLAIGCLAIVVFIAAFIGVVLLIWWSPPAVAPFLAAAVGFVVSRIYESYKESRQRLYDRKRDVYTQLLAPYQDILLRTLLNRDKQGDEKAEVKLTDEAIGQATNAAFGAILYASDEVVKAYGDFRNNPSDTPPAMFLIKLSRLLKAMRRDLGHSFTALSDVEILRMVINFKPGEEDMYK